MQVAVEPEAKKRAVHPKKTYPEETLPSGSCYFSPDHKIGETQASITEAKFGFSLCSECVIKVGKIINYVIELNFQ